MKIKKLSNLLKGNESGLNRKIEPYDTQAEVKRIENGIAWVHIAGGVDETPVNLTINAKVGDTVQVRVGGGRAWLTGNASAPPTDDTRAIQAQTIATDASQNADIARNAADSAVASAESASASAVTAYNKAQEAATSATNAQTSANNALASATNAAEYASRALGNLSTVQSVAETLTWITQHGTMALTTDTALDPTHVYFIRDNNGDYQVGSYKYSIVAEPNVDNISTYYELTIDESLNNYVGTHLALTNDGLWLLPAASGTNKVLIATGAGSTYTTAGTYIIGSSGETLAKFSTNGLSVTTKKNNNIVEIANLGYGLGNAESGTAEAPYYTLGIRKSGEAVGNYSVAEGNGTTASALGSHAEGGNINVSGVWYYLTASGNYAHAEGCATTASGRHSHSEGYLTTASGDWSHAQNRHTIADQSSQTAIGKYNTANINNNLFVIGNGTADDSRSNAFTVDTSGNVGVAGDVNIASGKHYKINGTNLSASDVGALPKPSAGGVSEMGQHIDLHASGGATDYDVRLSTNQATSTGGGFLHINGQPIKDFVVDRGTSGSWYYRKWNSGKVEAWRTYDAGSQTPSQWVTGWYYKDVNVAIPSGIFSATPTHVVATNVGSDYQYSVFTACPTSSTSIKVRVVKPNSGAATPVLSIYASNMI